MCFLIADTLHYHNWQREIIQRNLLNAITQLKEIVLKENPIGYLKVGTPGTEMTLFST